MKKKCFIGLVLSLVMLFGATSAYAWEGKGAVNSSAIKIFCQKNKIKESKQKKEKKVNKGRKDRRDYIAVTGITLNKTSTTISVGSWERLTATIQPSNATDKKYYWFSDNSRIAAVNPSGKVTGMAAGTAKIWVVTRDGFNMASCSVTVTGSPSSTEVPVTSVSIVKTESTVTIKEGTSRLLNTRVLPDNATDKSVTWSTSNPDIVTVDRYGNITGVREGTATVRVTTNDGQKTDSCPVQVIAADEWKRVTGVDLNLVNVTIPVGFKDQLRYRVEPADASDQEVTWRSSNTNVALVDPYGTIEAKRVGTAIITVTTLDRSKTDTCIVTVVPAVMLPSRGILLNKVASTLVEGEYDYPSVIFYGADEDDHSLTWRSSDTDVATVNSSGRVTAKEPGTAVITVRTSNNWLASYTVTVIAE